MSDIKQHLLSRGVDVNLHNVVVDDVNCIATFYLWDLSGRLAGFQQYNPAGTKQIRNDEKQRDVLKYFTCAGVEGDSLRDGRKKLVVWGFETINQDADFIFICEGIFDAIKLKNAGFPAIAVLSNDPHHLKSLFFALSRKIIAVCDNDKAGNRLAKFADASLTVPSPYHDLGDMPQEEVVTWLKNYFTNL